MNRFPIFGLLLGLLSLSLAIEITDKSEVQDVTIDSELELFCKVSDGFKSCVW